MNDKFPIVSLARPEVRDRRPIRARIPILSDETLRRRREIADHLRAKIAPINAMLQEMTDEQRRSFFVKIEHDGPVQLAGTDLKALTSADDAVTLAICRTNNLDKLETKVEAFATSAVQDGHVANEALVPRLIDIAAGQAFDRLSEAVFSRYDELTKSASVLIEIELTTLAVGRIQRRRAIQQMLHDLNDALGRGVDGTIFEHEETNDVCRVVLRCGGAIFKSLVEDEQWRTRITYFDLQPTFQTYHAIIRDFAIDQLGAFVPPDDEATAVCVVDSGVTPGNPFLKPVIRSAHLRCFLGDASKNAFDENGHGSGVASLAAYYALNLAAGAVNTGKVWITSARVLDENNECSERLFSIALEEVIRDFAALGVRVFNLSANIIGKPWNATTRRHYPKRSWIARAIDRLTKAYDVVIVVSVGNLSLRELDALMQAAPYPRYLLNEGSGILDPGQAALALSVGSIAANTLVVGQPDSSAIAPINQPSPFTRSGPGMRREIKPELVDYGGNLVFDNVLRRTLTNLGTSIPVASNTLLPPLAHDVGTSHAAPRVTYKLARILTDLDQIGLVDPSGPLIRALAVNSAQQRATAQELNDLSLEASQVDGGDWRHLVGYGMVDEVRATYCDDYSIVLVYQGQLSVDKVAFFDIPIPASISTSGRNPKLLTVTVAFNPEVHHRGFADYFGTTLQWRLFRGDKSRDEIVAAMSDEDAAPAGGLELKGDLGVVRRSRGSVQHDVFLWHDHLPAYSAAPYVLAVTTQEKWNRSNPDPISYAVVVRVEELSQTVPIYVSIRNALTVQVPRARAGGP